MKADWFDPSHSAETCVNVNVNQLIMTVDLRQIIDLACVVDPELTYFKCTTSLLRYGTSEVYFHALPEFLIAGLPATLPG